MRGCLLILTAVLLIFIIGATVLALGVYSAYSAYVDFSVGDVFHGILWTMLAIFLLGGAIGGEGRTVKLKGPR